MIKKIRIKIISLLLSINESIFFYPKLKVAYRKIFNSKNLYFAIDVGVNIGQSIFFFKKINPSVSIIGFEPNKTLYSLLIKNKNLKNCQFFNLGCSNKNGELIFKENVLSESSTFEDVNENSEWLKKKISILGYNKNELIKKRYKVKTIKLKDHIHKNFKNKIIDIIKIDVEGHEKKVLEGLLPLYSKKIIRYIQIENHHDDMYKDDTEEIEILLNKNGFEKEEEIKHGFGNIVDVIYKNINFE
ncbi:hypothetical protein DEJ39_02015 [Bacteroidetes bacterium SCGC AAA795-G10]|nr:hypothetical protein DEJ39_02015 [Bacteroidetes bacterium SCGC AAA795-G10]